MEATLDWDGQLLMNAATGKIVHDGNITPIGGQSFAVLGATFDKNYAVNTIYSANLVPTFVNLATSAASLLPSLNDSDPSDATRPYMPTIGDRLDAARVSWRWYSGGWDNALASTASNPANNGMVLNPTIDDPLFQWHHQPFAYYDNYAPWRNGVRNPASAAHLQDENNFFRDLRSRRLPSVVFIKALGPDNEHPGYAGLLQANRHGVNLSGPWGRGNNWEEPLTSLTTTNTGAGGIPVRPPN